MIPFYFSTFRIKKKTQIAINLIFNRDSLVEFNQIKEKG